MFCFSFLGVNKTTIKPRISPNQYIPNGFLDQEKEDDEKVKFPSYSRPEVETLGGGEGQLGF